MKLTIKFEYDTTKQIKPIEHTCTFDGKYLIFRMFDTEYKFDIENFDYEALDRIVSLFFRIEAYGFPLPINTTELAI